MPGGWKPSTLPKLAIMPSMGPEGAYWYLTLAVVMVILWVVLSFANTKLLTEEKKRGHKYEKRD